MITWHFDLSHIDIGLNSNRMITPKIKVQKMSQKQWEEFRDKLSVKQYIYCWARDFGVPLKYQSWE